MVFRPLAFALEVLSAIALRQKPELPRSISGQLLSTASANPAKFFSALF